MCQSFDLTEEEFDEAWELIPEEDRRFISTLSYLNELFQDKTLRYRELPIEQQQFIAAADRGTCFSLLTESLAALFGTSVMVRVKQRRRRRSRRHSRNGSKDADDRTRGDGSRGEDVSDSEDGTCGDARHNEPNDHNKKREPS